jgi:hypothetical protein
MIPITDSGTNMILNTGVLMDILDNIGILLIATGFMLIRIPIMLIVGMVKSFMPKKKNIFYFIKFKKKNVSLSQIINKKYFFFISIRLRILLGLLCAILHSYKLFLHLRSWLMVRIWPLCMDSKLYHLILGFLKKNLCL